jgi:MFS family permease
MVNIRNEITDYITRLRSFTRNSKILLFSHASTRVGFGIFWVILNLYILELGFSPTFLGVFISSNLIASAVFLIPGGAISDRIGRKLTLVLSTGLMFWSVIILCTVQDKYFLILANSMRGVSESLILVTVTPFIMEQSENYERMHLFSINAALNSFSIMFGTLIGGVLPTVFAFTVQTLAVQYRYTLLTTALFSLLAFAPLFFIKEKKRIHRPSFASEPVFSGKRTIVLEFVIYSSIIGFGAGIIVPFFNVYFSQELHATAAQIGLIFSASQLTMGIASLVLPVVVRKFGKVKSTVLTQYLSIPFFLLIMMSGSLFIAFVGFFMRMAFMNMAHPAQQNFYMDHIREHERGKATSLSSFGSTLLRAVGSNVGGYFIAVGSFSHAFYLAALTYVTASTLFFLFFRDKEIHTI